VRPVWRTSYGHSPAKTGMRSPSGQEGRVCPARKEFALRCVLRNNRSRLRPSFNPCVLKHLGYETRAHAGSRLRY